MRRMYIKSGCPLKKKPKWRLKRRVGALLKEWLTPAKEGKNGTKEKLIFYINSVELKLGRKRYNDFIPLRNDRCFLQNIIKDQ
jgi:hypothetical protein